MATDITNPQGQERNLPVQILESDKVTPIDLTGGVLKFFIRKQTKDSDADSQVAKRSYDVDEIEFTSPTTGEALIKLRNEDTENIPGGTYKWCGELTIKGLSQTTAGTVDVTGGSGQLIGTGLSLGAIHSGDILLTGSALSANNFEVTVSKELDALGVETGNLISDYTGWTTEAGLSITVFRGQRKFPDDLNGDWIIPDC
jgi:hypothetical protein